MNRLNLSWHGTLAEDGLVIITQKNINIVKELMNRGIVNSICSKNDFDKAKAVLCEAHSIIDCINKK